MYKRTIEVLVVACFALSGMSALMYQTAWTRLFSIAFGTSELAIATVLAAYMGGLALGSVVAGKRADFIRHPIKVYGLLEGGIAAAALLVPWMLDFAFHLYGSVFGSQSGPPASGGLIQTFYYLVATFLIVGVPTAFMGATLPILAHHLVRRNSEVGPKIGLMYGINTAGGVAGVLLGAFVLLPAIGLNGLVYCAVLINGIIFVLAVWLSRYSAETQPSDIRVQAEAAASSITHTRLPAGRWFVPHWILWIMLLSGAASFIYEVLWTRLLGHMLGSSIYAFATMLSTFLAGIAIGGASGGWFSRKFSRPAMLMVFLQILIAIASAATYYALEFLLADSASAIGQIVLAMLVILPSALFIGATYPVAVRIYTRDVAEIGASSASVYAWNTVGAIVGAIVAGFILLPGAGFAGAIRFVVLLNLGLALISACFLFSENRSTKMGWAPSVLLVVFVGCLLMFNPPRPDNVVSSTSFEVFEPTNMRELYFAVGKSSTVMLSDSDHYFDLRSNGLPEAQIFFRGSMHPHNSQRWLGLLPVLTRPDAESMLVIGLGGGTVVEGIPQSVSSIDVVELEENIVEANRLVGQWRNSDPTSDERVTIVVNDARNALNLTQKKYDVIVSQPSHPWTAGASHLFTQEFIRVMKSHLSEDGVLLMWMNSEFLTEDLLLSLMATIQSEFENVRVYETQSNVLNFLASDGSLTIDREADLQYGSDTQWPHEYQLNGVVSSADIVAKLRLDEQGVRAITDDVALVTDDRNLMATESRPLADGLRERFVSELFASHDPLLNPDSELRSNLTRGDLILISKSLLNIGQIARAYFLFDNLNAALIPAIHADISLSNPIRSLELIEQSEEIAPLFANAQQYRARVLMEDVGNTQVVYDLLADLDVVGSTVAEAWLSMRGGRPEDAGRMDELLKDVPVSNFLYGTSLELRAEWRIILDSGGSQALREAKRLIEISIAEKSTYKRNFLRAIVAAKLDDSSAFLESTAALTLDMSRLRRDYLAERRRFTAEQLVDMVDSMELLLELLGGNELIFDREQRAEVVERDIRSILSIFRTM